MENEETTTQIEIPNPHVLRDSCSWCGRDLDEPATEDRALCSEACRKAYRRFAA